MTSARFRSTPSEVLLAAMLMAVPFAPILAQQAQTRTVDANDVEQINDAVLISSITVAGKPIEAGLFVKPPVVVQPVTPFPAGNEWLRQMTISLVNRTSQVIVFGALHFLFLDTGDCQSLPCIGMSLAFGKRPAVDAYSGITGEALKPEHPDAKPLNWQPGETMVIHVSDYMDEIEQRLADAMPASAVTKLKMNRDVFYLADGMQWALGRYSIPNPEHRGKFDRLPTDYFPGRRGNNWPPGYNQ